MMNQTINPAINPTGAYSERLDFTPKDIPRVRLLFLKVHNPAQDFPGKRQDLYLDLPGILTDRKTGRQVPHTLTLLIGRIEKYDSRWIPGPTTLEWMQRRGQPPQVWKKKEQAQRSIRKLARQDPENTTQEILNAVRSTTMRNA